MSTERLINRLLGEDQENFKTNVNVVKILGLDHFGHIIPEKQKATVVWTLAQRSSEYKVDVDIKVWRVDVEWSAITKDLDGQDRRAEVTASWQIDNPESQWNVRTIKPKTFPSQLYPNRLEVHVDERTIYVFF